jgi:hypothetical protein
MFVTRHNSVVERGLLERLWELYELSYRRTAEESATREMFFRSEFDAAVADSRNRLWVLWADEEPVAMVLIATDIGSTRYLSQPFFERHFTDHARRGAVHYILFVVVHPRYAAKGALTRMARDVLGTEAAEGVLLVFDSPEYNQPRDEGGVALADGASGEDGGARRAARTPLMSRATTASISQLPMPMSSRSPPSPVRSERPEPARLRR